MPGTGARLADEIDVRDYLTGGDKINETGGQDVLYAVQRAVDEAMATTAASSTTRQAYRRVHLPAGLVPLSAPLAIQSTIGFHLTGVGGATRICPFDGASSMTSLIDLNGTAYSSFSNFHLIGRGSTTVNRAIWVRWNGVQRSSTQNEFRNIQVQNLRYIDAFQVGDPANPGVQVDQTNWFNCTTNGQSSTDATLWQRGFHFGEGTFGNNVIHSTFGCGSIRNKWNVHVDACQTGWFGGIVQSGAVDFFINSAAYFRAAGFRSELSGRLVETAGPATFPQHVTFDDVDWHCEQMNADGYFAKVRCGGVYKFRNVYIPRVASKTPKIIGDGTGAQLIEVDGVCTSTPAATLVAGTSTNGQVKIRSHIEVDSSGAAAVLTVN